MPSIACVDQGKTYEIRVAYLFLAFTTYYNLLNSWNYAIELVCTILYDRDVVHVDKTPYFTPLVLRRGKWEFDRTWRSVREGEEFTCQRQQPRALCRAHRSPLNTSLVRLSSFDFTSTSLELFHNNLYHHVWIVFQRTHRCRHWCRRRSWQDVCSVSTLELRMEVTARDFIAVIRYTMLRAVPM